MLRLALRPPDLSGRRKPLILCLKHVAFHSTLYRVRKVSIPQGFPINKYTFLTKGRSEGGSGQFQAEQKTLGEGLLLVEKYTETVECRSSGLSLSPLNSLACNPLFSTCDYLPRGSLPARALQFSQIGPTRSPSSVRRCGAPLHPRPCAHVRVLETQS